MMSEKHWVPATKKNKLHIFSVQHCAWHLSTFESAAKCEHVYMAACYPPSNANNYLKDALSIALEISRFIFFVYLCLLAVAVASNIVCTSTYEMFS